MHEIITQKIKTTIKTALCPFKYTSKGQIREGLYKAEVQCMYFEVQPLNRQQNSLAMHLVLARKRIRRDMLLSIIWSNYKL